MTINSFRMLKNALKTPIVWGTVLLLFILSSCGEEEVIVPKPRGYFRINLPQHQYQPYDGFSTFSFEKPTYASISGLENRKDGSLAFNLEFSPIGGTLFMTYFKIQQNLSQLLEDQHQYINKHLQKAVDVRENRYTRPGSSTFAMLYDIQGTSVASPVQFYITDSTRHFLRGSLYFNVTPNNDSLSPIIEYLKKDIDHLIQTLKWK